MLAAHNLDEENFQNELEKINEKAASKRIMVYTTRLKMYLHI